MNHEKLAPCPKFWVRGALVSDNGPNKKINFEFCFTFMGVYKNKKSKSLLLRVSDLPVIPVLGSVSSIRPKSKGLFFDHE